MSRVLIAFLALMLGQDIAAVHLDCAGHVARRLVREGEDEEAVLGEIVSSRTPVVIEGSKARSWAAAGHWDEEFVKRNFGNEQIEFRSSKRRVFTIRSPNRNGWTLRSTDDVEKDKIITFKHGSFKDVLEDDDFAYFSGPAELPEDVEESIKGAEIFSFLDKSIPPETTSYRIWHLGHKGVTAQLHYDKSRNFLAQIQGRKHVLLFKPQVHWDLHVFPSVHFSRRQSQLSVLFENEPIHENENVSLGIETERKEELERSCSSVILDEGEVLYIPPFFFHQIEYLDFAISMSIISPSLPEFLFGEITHQKLPMHSESFPKHALQISVATYLKEIGNHDEAFFQKLLNSRFAGLALSVEETEPEIGNESVCNIEEEQLDRIKASLAKNIKETHRVRDQMFAEGFKVEFEMLLADFVEHLARFGLGGSPQRIPEFLSALENFEW